MKYDLDNELRAFEELKKSNKELHRRWEMYKQIKKNCKKEIKNLEGRIKIADEEIVKILESINNYEYAIAYLAGDIYHDNDEDN